MHITFLLKNNLAIEANAAAISALEGQKKKNEKEAAEELAEAKKLKERIRTINC